MAKERHREKERKRDRKGETLNHLSIHQWVRSAIFASHQLTSPIGFPFLKLPPPPCAVLLVLYYIYIHICIYILCMVYSSHSSGASFSQEQHAVNGAAVMLKSLGLSRPGSPERGELLSAALAKVRSLLQSGFRAWGGADSKNHGTF